MSDKEDYCKEETSAGEQPKTHHQWKPWQKKKCIPASTEKRSRRNSRPPVWSEWQLSHLQKSNGMHRHEAVWKFRRAD